MRLRTLVAFSLILFGVAIVGLVLGYADHAYGGAGRRPVHREDIAAVVGVGMIVLGVALAAFGIVRRGARNAGDGELATEADDLPNG